MPTDACGAWDNGDCEGTRHCPPRCPRFADDRGAPYLLLDLGERSPRGAEGLVEMYREYPAAHRSMGIPPREVTAIRDWLARLDETGRNVLAWTWEGDVVGHACFAPTDEAVPEMLVYVDPEYHGRGLGTELVQQVVARADAGEYQALTLHVDGDNDAAISVYRSLGFETVRRHAMELEMRLSLSGPGAERTRLAPAARA